MMFLLNRLWSVTALAVLAVAAPSRPVPRGMNFFRLVSKVCSVTHKR